MRGAIRREIVIIKMSERASRSAVIDKEIEVDKEDESYLRNNWKLVSVCQFLTLFKSLLKLKDTMTPYDLEQSLHRPQHDPLCGEVIARVLEPRRFAKKELSSHAQSTALAYLGGGGSSHDNGSLDYDEWNKLLAKKFFYWFKHYAKFSARFLGFNPLH
jgi:hypothetical protein